VDIREDDDDELSSEGKTYERGIIEIPIAKSV
jgi:hypothetical protein